nr:hypothetical protein [Tanacetum cinerariifolium]
DKMVLGSGVGGDGEWCRAVLVSGGGGWKKENGVSVSAGKGIDSLESCISQRVDLQKTDTDDEDTVMGKAEKIIEQKVYEEHKADEE